MKNNAVAIAVRWADAYQKRTRGWVEVHPGEEVSIECADGALRISPLSTRYEVLQGNASWSGSLEEALRWAEAGKLLV